MTDPLHLAAAVAIACAGAWAVWRLWPRKGWQAGPRIGLKNYSPDVQLEQEPGCILAFDMRDEIHYLTRDCTRIGPTLRIVYEIEADPDTRFYDSETQTEGAFVTAHFQRRGDNWKGSGGTQHYRWWSPLRQPLKPGRGEMVIAVDGWTNVIGQTDAIGLAAAMADPARVGLTFGGRFYGHGAHSDGPAVFKLIAFEGAF